jgi:hypothetical protein
MRLSLAPDDVADVLETHESLVALSVQALHTKPSPAPEGPASIESARIRRDLKALVRGWLDGVSNLRGWKQSDADVRADAMEKSAWALQHILGERIAAGGLSALGAIYGKEWGDGAPDPSMPPSRALADREAALELVRKVEWAAWGNFGPDQMVKKCCPICGGIRPDVYDSLVAALPEWLKIPESARRDHATDCIVEARLCGR